MRDLTFRSVRTLLSWYFEARARLQTPQTLHPHTEPAPNVRIQGRCRSDTRVLIQVDGGEGGNLDTILATISTIGAALATCAQAYPRGMEALTLQVRDGWNQQRLAQRFQISGSTISAETGHAEAFLKGRLHDFLR